MTRTSLALCLAVAFAAPAVAQDSTQTATPDPSMTEQPIADPAPMPTASTKSGHSTTVYHGPHNHKGQHRGHAGDPAMIDHSADSLIVQPTSTKVTVTQ